MSPFEFVKSVAQTKEYIMVDQVAEKAYVPHLINRTLSLSVSTLMHANEMNLKSDLDHKLQYDYYFYILPKVPRSGWIKKFNDINLMMIQDYYQCNLQKAQEALAILTKKQLETIRKRFEQGGTNESSRYPGGNQIKGRQ